MAVMKQDISISLDRNPLTSVIFIPFDGTNME